MQKNGVKKNQSGSFDDCDSNYVFSEVKKRLSSSESRSLWRRIEKELQDGGVGGADTYLRSNFSELVQKLRADIVRYEETL
jgi:hypothetical protein